MAWVAAAGPAMNIALAIIAALGVHLIGFLPADSAHWVAENLQNALIINVVLAIFNLFPLPPLDGGRIAVGLLPDVLAVPLARVERYGMLILIAFLIVLLLLGRDIGADLSIISRLIMIAASAVIDFILRATGNL
jgi:Zn-dependent protease